MAADLVPSADALTGPALHDAKRALRDQVIAARDALDAKDRAVASGAHRCLGTRGAIQLSPDRGWIRLPFRDSPAR